MRLYFGCGTVTIGALPLVDFCGYLTPLSAPTGLFIGNANIGL